MEPSEVRTEEGLGPNDAIDEMEDAVVEGAKNAAEPADNSDTSPQEEPVAAGDDTA
jgi:hypothetical protein